MCAIPVNISASKKLVGGFLKGLMSLAARQRQKAPLLLGFFVRFLRYEEGENGKL